MIWHQKLKYLFLIFFQIIPVYLEAASSCTEWVAKVVSVQGKVETQHLGGGKWNTIQQGDVFCRGDKIRSQKNSRATLQLSNNSLVSVDQNTSLNFSVPKVDATASWLIDLIKGSTFFRSRESQHLNIDTPFINAVHEGTEFLVTVDSEQTEITVFDGQVAATNQQGKINIKKGFMGIAKKAQAPRVQALTIYPEDAVEWTLYYPPLIDYQHYKSTIFQSVINTYDQGDTYQTIDKLENFPVDQQNADYLILKSSLLLTVGRVDEALLLIKQARSLNQDESTAISLESVIAVTKNRQDEALSLAQQAVTLNPQSTVAQIALSYAYQSNFKIKSALQATQEAIRLSPDNALAWARLSELQLSTGERSEALESAKKAQVLNPQLDRTQTILGFAYLAEVDIDEAKSAFIQAINLNSADPLARLGLGLAKIRKGDVEEGALDIEIAVSLDPDNPIMRSYLGKAYYELKNNGYAGTELAIAKEMDSNDPTPWFYDAIRKQTTNRPVEALHDMQKAIELNDNRGIYRSSLLLDKDSAARSAAQGRIYNELGFQQRGLFEGWKSVNRDPANYSAHRLLADNYAALPRHEIARVSELLQSQLLQPINIAPIQPNLAESNLFILNGLGPSDLSYNEFNPLYEYNRLALQASGFYGSNNTWGDNVAVSGLQENFSFSLGQFHYETDGFRTNNFLKKDLYNAFLQAQVTDNLNLQAEYRHEVRDNGDLALNFNLNNFSSDFKEKRIIDSYRLGGRYEINSNSSLIGSFIYQEVDENQITKKPLFGLGFFDQITNRNRDGFIVELQNLYRKKDYSIVSGIGHLNQKKIDKVEFDGTKDAPEKTLFSRTNLYSYSKFVLPENFLVTLGLSVDVYKSGGDTLTPINPKIGLEWSPFDSTTIRAALFRSLAVTREASQTIEPTQVAGFNQFFDELNGTVTWRYGGAVDHKFSRSLSIGGEYSERKLYIPGFKSSVDRSEQFIKSYFNFTPNDRFSLGIEYFFEKIINPPRSGIEPQDILSGGLFDSVETHRVPISLGFFHPSGLTFKIKNTFVHQRGLFRDMNTQTVGLEKSDFFLVDMNISYRFPKRYGMISFGVNNLFDDQINFQNTNNNEVILAPGRILFTRINIAFN